MSDLTDHTYEKLCADYDEIINESIILDPPKDRTIFDISEYPHYENVISNWYAFFFDPDAEHSLDDLFLKSLIEIIKKDNNEFDMKGCHVKREFPTDNGRFIDLLLYEQTEGSEEDETFNSAIIIENKIYAPLNNVLNDYYDSVKTEGGQKAGIVLSLHKVKVCHAQFFNVTHEKLLEVVQHNLGEYVVSANPKYILYLQDFISNLEQMTRPKK